ncbi:dCTP deaminase [Candidatus Woesebacteria bacterium GWB1_43_5]|uniref:dCTP deaminase n=1 Tax=Candidatus Woesebacteria bacterium GWB1_43_5 TaxID=1802474 RepID=A0A1F7WSM4_9BACT|nr:MAG: dCTP deaminase [Candidatus Woesebacteria bacterium GWB1_43_5]
MAEIDNRLPIEAVYGTLPDWAIRDYIQKRKIIISPLLIDWEKKVDPVSIDLRLGIKIKILRQSEIPIDPRVGVTEEDYEEIDLLDKGSYVFNPGQFVIAETLERVTLPSDVKGVMEGKSSLARVGVGVFVTSARFDPGWDGNPVLELTNSGNRPFILLPEMKICAFSFERLMASAEEPYHGRYTRGDVHSLIHVDNGTDEPLSGLRN